MAKAATAPEPVDFDPMIYDIMRETATELRGEYIWLSDHADTAAERDAATTAHITLWQDVNIASSSAARDCVSWRDDLSAAELREIFDRKIAPTLTVGVAAELHPSVVFVGAARTILRCKCVP
ncbi:MAG: hypothetical protein V4703_03970 [Actinomycetota bacterium]